jgi:hypothetical protein
MVVGGLGGKTANSGLRFGCLVQQPVNCGGLPLQTAAIHMVGGGLGRQTTKKHGLAPRPPKLCGLPCCHASQQLVGVRIALVVCYTKPPIIGGLV